VKTAIHNATTRTAADLLAEAGRTLYGDEWIARLARDIGVSPHTLRAWHAGRLHLSLTHDAVKDTLRLLERRRDEADRVATRIKEVINA
jgi:transposase-like protein